MGSPEMGYPQIHLSIMNFHIIYPRRSHIWHGVSLVLNYFDLAQRYLYKVIPALDRHRKLEATAASESYRFYRRNIEHRICI